jgi:hypothetical protein
MQKARPEDLPKPAAPTSANPGSHMASIGIPQFLKRMSMGVMNK